MNPIRAALLGGGSRGRYVYADYAKTRPQDLRITAIAEPDPQKRTTIAEEHAIPSSLVVSDWKDLFPSTHQDFDVIIIATQDAMHLEPLLKAIDEGYPVLCEKPVVPSLGELSQIAEKAKHTKSLVSISHVLRYTPFFTKIKQLIEEKSIGDLIGIELHENVGHIHISHSYVRGNWRKREESSPMILAKSCHDMDILRYLAGSSCETLSSYGDLFHFKQDNAPKGAPPRCTDGCPVLEQCPYASQKIYLGENTDWPVNVITTDLSYEGREKALKEGPYGRCVYHCDNNVVDHQSVSARFSNGVIASFTMSGFTMDTHRSIRVMGSKAELKGDMESGEITIDVFSTKERITYQLNTKRDGHGGGDEHLITDFIARVRSLDIRSTSDLSSSLESHFMAFAAEESRLSGGEKIDLASFQKQGRMRLLS
ncbi:Gfo/Idh/MocA family oxidoreductase [uncultured Sphaerochaeta sp.]|uniref:Gfo/Idh/MocA family protein n=1 Tax=uncultured Sphaerochaeta sp. TaxID=886478 RepID=UPI002AA645D1|nr:Gfo/Idh/MocA family oxidoreductase [uncultured Sphaerochaeta sp.]